MAEIAGTWSIRAIARHYDVDSKTAHHWTRQAWFPAPVHPSAGRGYPELYDPEDVKRAVRNWRARRRRAGTTRGPLKGAR